MVLGGYNNIFDYHVYSGKTTAQLKPLINCLGYEAIEFRPVNQDEIYLDSGSFTPERWYIARDERMPRLILQKLDKSSSEWTYNINWDQIYSDFTFEQIKHFAKIKGYEIIDFRFPSFPEEFLSLGTCTITKSYKGMQLSGPRLIVRKIEKPRDYFDSKDNNLGSFIKEYFPSVEYNQLNKLVDVTDYNVKEFRPPSKGELFITNDGNINECTYDMSNPRWIVERKND